MRSKEDSNNMMQENLSSSSESIDSTRILEKLLFKIFSVGSKDEGKFFVYNNIGFKLTANDLENQFLTQGDKIILYCLVKRKVKLNIKSEEISDLQNQAIIDLVNERIPLVTDKRPEEKLKCVVKKTIKAMIKKFKKKKGLKFSKPEIEEFFFKHYFSDIVAQTGQTMSQFLNTPKCSGKSGLFCPKTITLSFLKNIVKSKRFYEEFRVYIENNFKQNENKSRKTKLEKVVTACKKYMVT